METQLTAVKWLETQFQKDNLSKEILNVFKRSFEQALAMEKEQSECICVNVIQMILDESEQGKEINSKEIFEKCYKEIFKSE